MLVALKLVSVNAFLDGHVKKIKEMFWTVLLLQIRGLKILSLGGIIVTL